MRNMPHRLQQLSINVFYYHCTNLIKTTSSAHTQRAPLTAPASYAANTLSPCHPVPNLSVPPAPGSAASGHGPAPRKNW